MARRDRLLTRFAGALTAAVVGALMVAGCGSSDQSKPGDVPRYDGIGDGDVVTALGTEPFWNAVVDGDAMTYSTPDDPDGTQVAVRRFAGNGGLGIDGMLDGRALQMAIAPGECSDGMSDRVFPFTVTLTIGGGGEGGQTLMGCAYSSARPYTGGGE